MNVLCVFGVYVNGNCSQVHKSKRSFKPGSTDKIRAHYDFIYQKSVRFSFCS